MRVLVFGAGAMGSAVGGFLSQQHEVLLVGRPAHVEAIQRRGLKVTGIWGDHVFRRVRAAPSLLEDLPPPDLVLITTKAYDTEAAVKQVLPLVGAQTRVISFQNGIGNEETIARYVGAERTLGGMAIFGATLSGPGHVIITVYASECRIGSLSGDWETAKRIAAALSRAGIPSLPTDDIIREKWMKTFYNLALNPLSAILRVPYGVLGEHGETKEIMANLIDEGFRVASARSIRLKTDFEAYFDFFLRRQLPPTAQHRSSMLQDLERGKRTEVDYLNGAIVRLGKEAGVATPYNEVITGIIRVMERQPGGREKGR
jgi:2-dehydropantoate 2-reductase